MNTRLLLALSVFMNFAFFSAGLRAEENTGDIQYVSYNSMDSCNSCPDSYSSHCNSCPGSSCGSGGLMGDWMSFKSSMQDNGITFVSNITQVYQGVTHGGLEQTFNYGGNADYLLNFDFGKMGIQEGLFLKVRAETQFGESLGTRTGAVLPSAVVTTLPVADEHVTALTNFVFTQALSENFAVFAGKIDTLDGDMNAFAHGRGKTQFMSSPMIINPIAVRSIPYSSLACGFAILGEGGEPLFNLTVMNPEDTATTSGFDSLFEEGVAIAAELRIPVEIGGLPGHHLFAGTWNSRDYNSLDQDPRILVPALNVPIQQVSGSWSLYYNFDQYLFVDPCNAKRGWGVFGRAGISDGDPNPMEYFLSFGVGGSSPIRCREKDTFGVGWYYNGASNELGPVVSQLLGDGYGVEMFYNIAVTDNLYVTPDLQIIDGGIQVNDDTAIVAGVRVNLVL